MIQSLRGMNDLFDDESRRFSFFISTATAIAKRYGFEYIQTPILEETALFKRSVGESSDIVGKEMYRFQDKGENDVCMRPEGTAGVVRAFVQKKLDRAGGKHRYFYYGPMFRYERPQKGRLRQFHQFGAESFGTASVYEDLTVLLLIRDILSALGVGYRLKLNSLGCPTCMPPYREKLVNFVQAHVEHVCEDCKRRVELNPIRVLDCKNESCQILYKNAPKLVSHLCESCDADFAKLTQLLTQMGIAFEIDTHLVRGLDYYSKTAFEFVSDGIGAQNAIAGGGRYDRLVEFLDGKATPAVGFAIGIERILELIQMPQGTTPLYYFGAMQEEHIDTLFMLAQQKRQNARVHIEYEPRSFAKHLNNAQKIGAHFCMILGENEIQSQTIWAKNLVQNSESTLPWDELL
ncbi:MAG: histidyl-tRNA synthase [Sulfuricurvum sp. PC08-66]|nr:MAG: histidyl-tRNA synthase [Sulfuricurvum sp. PC08-66]